MNHASLFSGIGGFDLAAEWMGWNNIFNCEIDPFCRKVLNYYWPNTISYEDIRKTDFTIHRGNVDILTGGFPCQPFSVAGKRKGNEDDRYLWPEMLRAIRETSPLFVVGENVSGLLSSGGGVVFEQVLSDLENEGYEVQTVILPAAGVNAPHRRDRVWIVAKNTKRNGCHFGKSKQEGTTDGQQRHTCTGGCNWIYLQPIITNPESQRSEWFQPYGQCKVSQQKQGQPRGGNSKNASTNASSELLQGRRGKEKSEITECNLSPLLRTDSWQNFPTQPPVCSGDDGLSDRLDGITFSKWRKESLKAYGNAIVPQVAYQIFKAIIKTV